MGTKDDSDIYEELMKKDFLNFSKAKVFYDRKIMVHASLKNGDFFNGYIVEEPTHDFFIMDDREDGDVVIFYLELEHTLTQFEEDKKKAVRR